MSESTALDAVLAAAVAHGASDIHLTCDRPALMRMHGDLVAIPEHPQVLSEAWLESALLAIMEPHHRELYHHESEVDLGHAIPGVGRFRVNVFRQLGGIAAAMRMISDRIPALAELGVPPITKELALRPRGLVLVTGPTGSGKSTTLAAMVDVVNRTVPNHIITIEDPIEYLHYSKRALIHQREIGADTPSFGSALKHILRQDPDVILIGELRDPESISIALTAAETGHLVLGTLHTQNAAKTIDRIIDTFPANQQNQIRSQLSDTLQAVISQTLLPRAKGGGRVVATEVLVHTPAVGNLIREGQIQQLYTVMQSGSALGMHTLDQSLMQLVASGAILASTAKPFMLDPKALELVRVQERVTQEVDWNSYESELDQDHSRTPGRGI